MIDGLVDTKSVQILKRVAKTFDVEVGKVRFLGDVRFDAIDILCYHGGRSIQGTANGPQSPHLHISMIRLLRLCEFRSEARQVRSVVLAGQCQLCGQVACAEKVSTW